MSPLLSLLAAGLLLLTTDVSHGDTPGQPATGPSPRPSALAERLLRLTQNQGQTGADTAFGVEATAADWVFYPVAPWQSLPDDFVPPDLVRLGGIPRVLGQPISAIVMPDLESMVAEAHAEGVDLVVLSAYRSFSEQQVVFERNVQRSMYRPEGVLPRPDAERATERFSARPGHSQHQLGTAMDFTSAQIGYGLGARFADTDTGRWLLEHSWRFGFVFPYTESAEPRSGYRYEPWHVRWVGRQLAEIMHRDGYLTASFPIADDYVLAVREILVYRQASP
jgi:LAS superfamily LD-carboxypeptidase LdcB